MVFSSVFEIVTAEDWRLLAVQFSSVLNEHSFIRTEFIATLRLIMGYLVLLIKCFTTVAPVARHFLFLVLFGGGAFLR